MESTKKVSHQSSTSNAAAHWSTKTDHSPERCNLFGYPALFPGLFSAGTPTPACVCLSREAAGDSSPTASSGPRSAGEQQRVFPEYTNRNTASLVLSGSG